MKNRTSLTGSIFALVLLLLSATAQAAWTTYSYRNADNENVYGVKNGANKVPLNTSLKKAEKAAKKLTKNGGSVMAGPNGEGDWVGHGELPR